MLTAIAHARGARALSRTLSALLLSRTLVVSTLLTAAALCAPYASASVSLNPIFTSHMVLQEGMPCPVFGAGDVGSTVTVQFLNQTVSTTVPASGNWQVTLSSMSANAGSNTLTVSATGSPTITLTDVQVGEVWLFSGQSNMEFSLSRATGSSSYISDAANHDIRLFEMAGGNGPSTTSWQISNSTTAANFSAVGYWAGLDLSMKEGVPMGLIQATHDGTAISTWETTDGGTGTDYLNMVKAIQPFAIRGVGWYQGESNGGDSNYQTELTDMINEWRGDWGFTNLPFGIVQLPYTKWDTAAYAQFNVSQTVANTYLVVTHDLYSNDLLHPPDKHPVGLRLSIGARGTVYGEAIEYSGPIRELPPGSYVSGNSVVLNFTHPGNGLSTYDGAALGTFQIAGTNGHYTSATATISGNTVVVTSSVSAPKYLKYGFVSGDANLSNVVNIPVEGGTGTVTYLPTSLFELSF